MNAPIIFSKKVTSKPEEDVQDDGGNNARLSGDDDDSDDMSDIGMPVPMKRSSKPDLVPAPTEVKNNTGEDSPWDSEEEEDDDEDELTPPKKVVPVVEPLKTEASSDAVRPSKGGLLACS